MKWLKDNAEAIDWTACPALREQVLNYGLPEGTTRAATAEAESKPSSEDDDPSDDIPF